MTNFLSFRSETVVASFPLAADPHYITVRLNDIGSAVVTMKPLKVQKVLRKCGPRHIEITVNKL